MKIQLLEPNSKKWDYVLSRCVHDIYHTPTWANISSHSDAGQGLAVYASDGYQEFMVPFIRRELSENYWDASSPYGYGGPIFNPCSSKNFPLDALENCKNFLKEAGCVSWFVRLNPILNADTDFGLEYPFNHGKTVSVNLKKTENEHWKETTSGHRGDINRALRNGVKVELDHDLSSIEKFIQLYNQNMSRLKAKEYYFFDDRYYESLKKLGKNLILFTAIEDQKIIGSSMFMICDSSKLIQYHLSASDDFYRHRQPAKLLLHSARNWGRENGYSRMHLGGGLGAEEDSLFNFKKGFSHDFHEFKTLRLIVNKERYISLCNASDDNKQDISGFFPKYRKI